MKRNNKGEEKEQWDWRKKFTAEDIRFTTKGDTLYAIALALPEDGKLKVRSLPTGSIGIGTVSLLGHDGSLQWQQTADGLEVVLPSRPPCEYAFALKITKQGS
jgi:alpha-L-fucosidase